MTIKDETFQLKEDWTLDLQKENFGSHLWGKTVGHYVETAIREDNSLIIPAMHRLNECDPIAEFLEFGRIYGDLYRPGGDIVEAAQAVLHIGEPKQTAQALGDLYLFRFLLQHQPLRIENDTLREVLLGGPKLIGPGILSRYARWNKEDPSILELIPLTDSRTGEVLESPILTNLNRLIQFLEYSGEILHVLNKSHRLYTEFLMASADLLNLVDQEGLLSEKLAGVLWSTRKDGGVVGEMWRMYLHTILAARYKEMKEVGR